MNGTLSRVVDGAAGSARVCMMEQKKGSDLESWCELVEDWGTLGQGYHWTDLSQGYPLRWVKLEMRTKWR